jgi:hypothetical protein
VRRWFLGLLVLLAVACGEAAEDLEGGENYKVVTIMVENKPLKCVVAEWGPGTQSHAIGLSCDWVAWHQGN